MNRSQIDAARLARLARGFRAVITGYRDPVIIEPFIHGLQGCHTLCYLATAGDSGKKPLAVVWPDGREKLAVGTIVDVDAAGGVHAVDPVI